MNLEARYIDAGSGGTGLKPSPVHAIWCELNGRMRRFTVDNVRETKAAGHRFYVRGANQAPCDVYVVGSPSEPHLHTDIDGAAPNGLKGLPGHER